MRKFLFLFSALAFIGCNSEDKAKVQSVTSKNDSTNNVTYPYEISYSSKFEMGDPQQSKKILELWKDFDNGNLDNLKDYFADSVQMFLSDGSMMHNVRDSIIAAVNAYRNMFSAVNSQVDAIIPVRSTDKGENWVCVWGKEVHTMKGKVDSVDLQETWRFNKDGKVDFMLQYSRPYPKK